MLNQFRAELIIFCMGQNQAVRRPGAEFISELIYEEIIEGVVRMG